jgi:hypothetical protein
MSHKENTVRFTVDIPEEQHKLIKILAAKDGKTIKQFVIEHLPSPYTGAGKEKKIKKGKFKALLEGILTEYKSELKSLANR